MAAEEHDHDEHAHDHDDVSYAGTDVTDDALERVRATHPTLAENLDLARRFKDLDDAGRKRLVETQALLEGVPGWAPGYHAEGDKCAACGEPVAALFTDRFSNGGTLEHAAFLYDLPVHVDPKCIDGLRAKVPRPAPQVLDRLRRESMAAGARPRARMVNFYRHDVLAHSPFGLEDWANSVAEANPDGLDRATKNDMERLLHWVHARLYH
jgi:hypothetical protein